MTPVAHTLVDLLQRQADRYGDKVAFRFAPDGADEHDRLTYRELDAAARAIAADLQRHGAAGQRVLVLCRPGLEPITAFFGCLYAGAVAVPVHEWLLPRLTSVVPDTQAGFALATAATQAKVRATVDGLAAERPLRWAMPEAPAGDADAWVDPSVDAETTAMIQYTSGSTRSPKGVVLDHRNLMANLTAIGQAWGGTDADIAAYWLPPHHDMGLIGGILAMLHTGCTTVLMSPTAFITRPMRWLRMISRYRATMTAAPNFAYAKCVERSSAAERADLDLSCLATAMNGAEPVRAATLKRFAEAFAPAGFRAEAFAPVYGLAEATLLVSGGSDSARPVVRHLDRAALRDDRVADIDAEQSAATPVVGCGRVRGGQHVVIVDPETGRRCGPDEVGEIWVSGPVVAQGYWANAEDTEQTFRARVAETGEGPFLRTGDLGFLSDGELFITGRCKDLVIIDGNNYYPNDIEATVQDCHPVLLSGRGAIFAVPPESGAGEQPDEHLVVVQEVDSAQVGDVDLSVVLDAVRAAITRQHGLDAHAVLFVEKMRIPTTSSGKVQRSRCRQQYLDGEIAAVAQWNAGAATTPAAASGPVTVTEGNRLISVTLNW